MSDVFVGRDAPLRAIEGALHDARAGNPVALLLAGAAGIGKSELVRRWADGHRSDVTVLHATCAEGGHRPYLPLATALRPLGAIDDLLHAVPDDVALEQADARRARLFMGASDLLGAAAAARPVALVVDDVQWADPGTVELLGHLLRVLEADRGTDRGRVVVVLPHRPELVRGPVAGLMDELRASPSTRVVELGGLDRFELHDLVAQLEGAAPTPRLVRRLLDAAEGNPLIVQMLLQRLEAFNMLVADEHGLRDRGGEEVLANPSALDTLVRLRLDDLTQRCVQLLTVGALLGDGTALADVRAASGLPAARFDDARREAVAAGIVVDRSDSWCFVHPQVRQVVFHRPRGKRRRELHRAIADALAAGDAPDEQAIVIAHHLRRAGDEADPAQVAQWSIAAANQAASMVAWGEAAMAYDAALDALSAVEGAGAPSALRALLHARDAHAHWYDHDNAAAIAHAEAAIAIASSVGDVDLWARALETLAQATWAGAATGPGVHGDLTPFTALLDAAGDGHHVARARVHAVLASLMYQALDVAAAHAHATEALALVEGGDDPALVGSIELVLGLSLLARVRLDEARVPLTRRDERPALQRVWGTRALAMVEWAAGELDAAAAAARAADVAAEEAAAWAEQAWARTVAAGVAAARGHYAEAEQLAVAAARIVRWARLAPIGQTTFAVLAHARVGLGDAEGAHAAVDDLEALGGRRAHRLRALVAVRTRGEPAEPPRTRPLAHPGLFDVTALAAAVEVGEVIGAVELLRWAAPPLASLSDRGLRFGVGWQAFVPRLAGVAALGVGDLDGAGRLLDVALLAARRAGCPDERTRTEAAIARLHDAR